MLPQRSCGGRGGGTAGLAASQIVLFNEMSAHGFMLYLQSLVMVEGQALGLMMLQKMREVDRQ